MPMGIPAGYVHCKRCPKQKFKTVSELRQHQWRAHPELYANVHQTTAAAVEAERNRARTAKARAAQASTAVTVRQFIDEPRANGDMSVSDLLSELESQTNFLQKVIALVGGIQSRKSERISE